MEMKSPVESEFYPCRMSHAHMDDEKPSFEEDHEIYAEEMQTRIAKCKSECVKTVTRVNTSDFPTRVQQPVSKSHTHFKGKHSQSQRRKMRLEADYNLTRPRVRSTRAHPHIYHAYGTHPGHMPQTGGVQAPRAQRHSPPVSPPFVIGVPTEIRPTELRQARPRLIGMPNMMTVPPQHPPPPPMCNMGPPKANIQGPRVGPPPPPQPQGPRQMINDQAVYGYQPRQYFMNKYKVLPPVYANLAQEQCYMGGSVPPYQQHAIYQAHYQSHNDIHQQTNNNYARFNAIQQQQQPNQPQIYANWSPNWTGSGQLAGPPPPPPAAAAAAAAQQQPQPYNNQPPQPQRPQQQQPPQQQYQQPYMNHNNLVVEQSGTDQMNDPAAANNATHKKKSIITSIFTFPRYVFKGFK